MQQRREELTKVRLFDCCLNLTHSAFDKDREAMLLRAAQRGVTDALVCAADLQDSHLAHRMVTDFNLNAALPRLYSTSGVHPHCARTWRPEHGAELRQLALTPSCVALGEMGLDYARCYSPPAKQKEALQAQLEIAVEARLPVFFAPTRRP